MISFVEIFKLSSKEAGYFSTSPSGLIAPAPVLASLGIVHTLEHGHSAKCVVTFIAVLICNLLVTGDVYLLSMSLLW
jgi:hypothetical protein